MQFCKNFCSFLRLKLCPPAFTLEDYYYACQNGNMNLFRKAGINRTNKEITEALAISVCNNQKEILNSLLSEHKNESILTRDLLNNLLKEACVKGYYDIAEMLVKKGANPIKGIAVAKSSNIISMLYRY